MSLDLECYIQTQTYNGFIYIHTKLYIYLRIHPHMSVYINSLKVFFYLLHMSTIFGHRLFTKIDCKYVIVMIQSVI